LSDWLTVAVQNHVGQLKQKNRCYNRLGIFKLQFISWVIRDKGRLNRIAALIYRIFLMYTGKKRGIMNLISRRSDIHQWKKRKIPGQANTAV
jgi:hypothetical protein